MLRSAGERRATTPWGASAAFAPPASTTSRVAEGAQTSTSAPPPRTPASSAAPTQTGVTSVDARPGTTAPGKGRRLTGTRESCPRRFQLDNQVCVAPTGTVSQVWALVAALVVLDRKAKRMITLCLWKPATSVRSTGIPRRDASVAAQTPHMTRTCR